MMDSPPVPSRRPRVRRRATGSTSCVAAARTENRRRRQPPARPMALLLASCMVLLLAEMPALISARLHEQQQQQQDNVNPAQPDPKMDAANFIDYDNTDIDGGLAQQAEAQHARPDQNQDQEHRRLQEMKNEWPECIGMQAEDCVALIESEAPDAYTLIVHPADYDFHRVIIRVDSDSLVTKTPSRG